MNITETYTSPDVIVRKLLDDTGKLQAIDVVVATEQYPDGILVWSTDDYGSLENLNPQARHLLNQLSPLTGVTYQTLF